MKGFACIEDWLSEALDFEMEGLKKCLNQH